jgi:type IV secretion system protein VirB4
MTLFHGGYHYELGAPGGQRLQILGDLDTEEGRQWATLWVENILISEGLPPDPDERREIWKMINERLVDLPRKARTLTMARTLLQVQRLKVGLEPFCHGGEYAFCDGNEDTFAWESRLLCFEMSHLIQRPRALNAVLPYCFYKLESGWFNGDPVVISIDEAQWMMALALFIGQMDVWLLARAKKNVSVWLSLQNLAYLATTSMWQSIINNVPTKKLLPNPNALSTDVRPYYEALQIPGWAIEQIASAQPFRDYLYSSPLGTRMTQCALSRIERLLCAASTPEELAVLAQMEQTVPRERLAAEWLKHWNEHEAARYLEPEGDTTWSETISSPAYSASSLG